MDIKTYTDNSIYEIVSFILTITGAFALPFQIWKSAKQSKDFIQKENNQRKIRDICIITVYVTIGFLAPLFLIINSWSDPFTIGWLLLQIFNWYVILSFVVLLFIFKQVLKIIKEAGL